MKVSFLHDSDMGEVFPHPVHSAKAMPSYFKSLAPSTDGTPLNLTAKRCMPFIDAMAQGFVIPLWADMFVQTREGNITINFPRSLPMMKSLEFHGSSQLPGHPLSNKPYGNIIAKLICPWLVKTEPGVSCLFTSPFNHLETRFKILDGVVDTDTYYNNINFPFIWTEGDGDFLIAKGTPIIQVIPFRRQTIEIEVSQVDEKKRDEVCRVLGTTFEHGYRKNYRHSGLEASDPSVAEPRKKGDET